MVSYFMWPMIGSTLLRQYCWPWFTYQAEGRIGELKSVLGVHLGSTDQGCSTIQQVDARKEVQLLISLFAYKLIYVLRDLLQECTGEGSSLARLRKQALKVAVLTRVHARRLHIYLGVAWRLR
jgi:hypothetical protein